MKKVMVLCTGNSCRSQMAEGFLRALGEGGIEAHSAGLYPAGLNSRAVAVMNEVGIDISGQRSKSIDPDLLASMDIVLTVCGNAEKSCPVTPSVVKRIHVPVDDPVGTIGDDHEIMDAFRRARDEILQILKEQGFIQ
jgi:arsenate reductase